MEVNVNGLFNVLEVAVANGAKRVCMASSIGAMGLCGVQAKVLPPVYLPVDENHPCRPEGMYGSANLLAKSSAKCTLEDMG